MCSPVHLLHIECLIIIGILAVIAVCSVIPIRYWFIPLKIFPVCLFLIFSFRFFFLLLLYYSSLVFFCLFYHISELYYVQCTVLHVYKKRMLNVVISYSSRSSLSITNINVIQNGFYLFQANFYCRYSVCVCSQG